MYAICVGLDNAATSRILVNPAVILFYQTCNMIRITDTDFGGFLSDTAVLHFDTDFN